MSVLPAPEMSYNFSVLLWENVQNMAEVKQAAVDGKLQMVLLNPALILHPDHIFVAVNKSLRAKKHGQMKTRNVFTEILYSLYPSRNIKEAFKTFGVKDASTAVIVVVSGADTTSIRNALDILVHGEFVPIKYLPKFNDLELIKRVYKVQNVKDTELLESIISRIAVKDVI